MKDILMNIALFVIADRQATGLNSRAIVEFLWLVRCTSFNLDSTLSTVPSVIFCHVTWQQCWQHAQGIFGLHEDHTCVCQFLKFICDSQRFNPLAIRHHNIIHGG